MKVIKKKLSDLHAPEQNIRMHPQKQIKEYIRSIEMFGQTKPLVVDGKGEVIIGNGLFIALTQMGAKDAEVYIMPDLTENQKKKLMLADNKVYELGLTDMNVFDDIVKSLEGDVDIPGWDKELLEMMNAAEQDIADISNGYGNFEPEAVKNTIKPDDKS